MTARRTADDVAEKMATRRTPPPAAPPAPARELPPPPRVQSFVRRNADLTDDQARRLDRAVQDIADARGWRRGNVGDVLVTLVDLLLTDPELQRQVTAAVPVPRRVKHVR